MLILERRVNEAIVIDGHIRVTVTQIRGGVVKIGVDAPKSVSVHREEVELAITRAQKDRYTR